MEIKDHIYIATSEKQFADSLRETIGRTDLEVIEFQDGVSLIKGVISDRVPNLIIADIDLPLIDGIKIFHILQNNPKTKNVPFIFIAGHHHNIMGFRPDLDAFFTRPVRFDQFMHTLNEILSKVTSWKSTSPLTTDSEERAGIKKAKTIKEYRNWLRNRYYDAIEANLKPMEARGLFPFEGKWRNPDEIKKLQTIMQKKDRIIFGDLLGLLLLLLIFNILLFVLFNHY